jgi:hypothetical protein
MKFSKIIGLLAVFGIIVSCGSKLPDNYHMDKKYWDVSDYDAALRYMKYYLDEEEGLPRLSDPLTAPVFKKLVDKQNVSVVLEDDYLGLKYRDDVADGYWDASKDILKLYQVLDIQDKYVYPIELVKAMDFFLHTQLLYFKIGNQKMLNDIVDPNDKEVKRLVRRNQQTIVNNFNNNLDFLAKEDVFSSEALNDLAVVISNQYSQLLIDNPNSNYSEMKRTIGLLIEKCESDSIGRELNKLLARINDLKK